MSNIFNKYLPSFKINIITYNIKYTYNIHLDFFKHILSPVINNNMFQELSDVQFYLIPIIVENLYFNFKTATGCYFIYYSKNY